MYISVKEIMQENFTRKYRKTSSKREGAELRGWIDYREHEG